MFRPAAPASSPTIAFRAVALSALLTAAACSTPGPGEASDGVWDPYEVQNRRAHEINKTIDTAVVSPVARGYGAVVPEGAQLAVGRVSSNLSTPSYVVNDLLQFQLGDAAANTFRFAMNSTFGLLGLFDPAEMLGVPSRETNFGETLHVWGAPEGAYTEVPLLGPSTQRDFAGTVVDLFTNPFSYVLPEPERYIPPVAHVADRLGQRDRYRGVIDGVLYESADSYAAARIAYLQNRRAELGMASAGYADPYDLDPYDDLDPGTAPADGTMTYGDPYDDPYLQ